VDFVETTETENENGSGTEKGNTESACSQVPSCADLTCDAVIAHVFFEVYLPVSAPVLSGTRLPWFPDQGPIHSVDCSVAHSLCLYCKLMYFFLCIIVARSVSLATHLQCYVCTADSVLAMVELAYSALYSGV